MSPINIIFATPTYSKLNWLDSCEGVGEEEIRDLILFLRGALAALSAELDDRRNTRKDENLESYKRMLWETAKQINEQGLTETHERCLGSLGSFLAQAEVERKESKFDKATRQYLWLISKAIGWPWVRFIWCALGKCKVKHLNEGQRIKLVKYIAKHRESFFCRSLEDRVVQCQSQEICMNPCIDIIACSKIAQISKPIIHHHKVQKSGRDKMALRIVKALPLLHMNSISKSWYQAPSKTLRGPILQVRLKEHH